MRGFVLCGPANSMMVAAPCVERVTDAKIFCNAQLHVAYENECC